MKIANTTAKKYINNYTPKQLFFEFCCTNQSKVKKEHHQIPFCNSRKNILYSVVVIGEKKEVTVSCPQNRLQELNSARN